MIKSHIKKIYNVLLVLLSLCFVMGCAKKDDDGIDFGNKNNWAYYAENSEHDVDIFFIAPTAGADASYNMSMTDEDYKRSFCGAIAMEKGIYDELASFYAPYYRQVSLECYDLPEEEREQYLEIAYKDVADAFNYYIENINNGRPYIIAGFSQGADMTKRLLENNKNIDDKMIAAYAIGWNFTKEDEEKYPNIKMAQGEDDLGVVVSFCSEAPEYNGENLVAPNGTIGINPINWKTDSTVATKEENLGACFTNYSGVVVLDAPNLCGAYLDENRGTLKVTDVTPEEYPAGLSFFEEGNYHLYDYQFFYRNLKQNVEKRITKYLNQ